MEKIKEYMVPLILSGYVTVMIGTVAWIATQLFALTGATSALVERVDALGVNQDQLIEESREHTREPHSGVEEMIELAIMGLRLEFREEIDKIQNSW